MGKLWGVAPDHAYADGNRWGAPLYRWDGRGWRPIRQREGEAVTAIWASGEDNVFVATAEGTTDTGGSRVSIAHSNGAEWTTSRWHRVVRGLWGPSPGEAWAVGDGGLIQRHVKGRWRQERSPTRAHLSAVWGSGPDDVWAVGTGGTVLRWRGDAWASVPSGTDRALTSVWGSGPDDVWIAAWGVGVGGLLHWDGSSFTLGEQCRYATMVFTTGPRDVWADNGQGNTCHFDGVSWRFFALPVDKRVVAFWGERDRVLALAGLDVFEFVGPSAPAPTP